LRVLHDPGDILISKIDIQLARFRQDGWKDEVGIYLSRLYPVRVNIRFCKILA